MANKQSHGLGSGLSALIPKELDKSFILEAAEKIQKLAIDLVEPNSDQPRKQFDDTTLKELADSIKKHGVLQPIVVSPKGANYQIVAGERRWRAAKLAGSKTIPAIVRTLKELEQLELAMVENVQRVDLSPIEQALGIEKLHEQFSLSYETIAKRLGKALTTVNNISRLLKLPPEAIEALNKKFITEGHARAILALKSYPEHQQYLIKACASGGWSVRQAERYVVSVKEGAKDIEAAKARVALVTPETKLLSSKLKTKVHVRRMAKGGRLEITFTSDDDLTRIIKQIA